MAAASASRSTFRKGLSPPARSSRLKERLEHNDLSCGQAEHRITPFNRENQAVPNALLRGFSAKSAGCSALSVRSMRA